MLAGVVRADRVPVDAHFFDDLGADSLVMAQFCARVRKRDDLPSVSMKDIYQHPTINGLAAALGPCRHRDAALRVRCGTPRSPRAVPRLPVEAGAAGQHPAVRRLRALQLLVFLGYSSLAALVTAGSFDWISAASGVLDVYLRSVAVGGALFVVLCTLPIVAKWLLIGRWKPRQIRVWSLTYVRFWIVKTLVRRNPLACCSCGSPLYALYLRALGAKIGRGVVIFSRNVPVCTDLLTIGDGTVIRKDSFLNGYRAHDGMIQTGPVTLGKDVLRR